MGIVNGLKRQLRSVIEWKDTDSDQLFYQWTDNGDEIKNASIHLHAHGLEPQDLVEHERLREFGKLSQHVGHDGPLFRFGHDLPWPPTVPPPHRHGGPT